MNSQAEAREIQRYVALDIHKEYVMVGAMNAAQEWVIRPRRIEMAQFRTWAVNNLRSGDAVVTLEPHASAGVTKSGRKELRWALIEAAWKAVQMSAVWKQRYEELKKRRGACKAIVATPAPTAGAVLPASCW